jgi:hypothetical protein
MSEMNERVYRECSWKDVHSNPDSSSQDVPRKCKVQRMFIFFYANNERARKETTL